MGKNPRIPLNDTKRILLVEPDYPIPTKSKNHQDFLPIGLLKIASYLKSKKIKIKLIRGIPKDKKERQKIRRFNPQEIWITSLFTYWSKYVKQAVSEYKDIVPSSIIVVGGIYASLFERQKVKERTGCDLVYQGVFNEAESLKPNYGLIKNINPHPVDYQILHASRGCERKCDFCGTWKIEPNFEVKSSISDKIFSRKLVFYDNNFLANPHAQQILQELVDLKAKRKILWCEAQSGFDGRILLKKPTLASMIKNAGFRYPRIAWDWSYKQKDQIREQIDLLEEAGYPSKNIFIFMLYNWDISFEEMEMKRIACWDWKVQISDCRYRPLDQIDETYNPRKWGQTSDEYYIHEEKSWTDYHVKQFRRNVRQQNICVRHGFPFYANQFERKKVGTKILKAMKKLQTIEEKLEYMDKRDIQYWIPYNKRYPQKKT